MKKTIITALVVLLVILAFATCDGLITDPGAENSGNTNTASGRKLVTVKIKVSSTGSRALTDDLARSKSNYMEVIFEDGDEYYRAEGTLSQTLTMKIPAKVYDKYNSIILIGRKNGADYTLLAVGTIDDAAGIDVETTSTVIFNITALTADLYAGGKGVTTSTFSIDANKPVTSGSVISLADQGFTADKINDGTFADDETLCFQVAKETTGIEAKLDISGFGNTVGMDDDSTPAPYQNIITGSLANAVTFYDYEDTTTASTKVTLSTSTIPTFTFDNEGDDLKIGTIGFKFDTTDTGYYIITFDVPVVGFAASGTGLGDALTWHIRGGTTGPATIQPLVDSGEQGVALAVKSNPRKMTDVNVGPIGTGPNWPQMP